jgi:serine/threonine protein kinase
LSSRESARRFQFLREIASGGFGSVYLAKVMHPDGFSRLAAVKLLHRRWTENEEVARRMRDEARLLGWLRHRNIVDVVDLTSIDGRAAIVMEYLEAVDLKVIIRAATVSGDYVPPSVALEVAGYVASALDAAYNRPPYAGEKPLRVIHRDIKPSNIMVDDSGLVKVLDFGVARAEFDTRESETRELQFGSVDYMPPERLFFEPDTPAADIYSLASTLFELLVLEKFGKAKMSLSKHTAFVEERLAYMRSCLGMQPAQSQLLEDFLRTCLGFDPEHRPSGSEVVTHCRSLARLLDGPSLIEWAEMSIPPLIAAAREAPRKPNPLTDSVLTEDSLAFGGNEAKQILASDPEPQKAAEPAQAEPANRIKPPVDWKKPPPAAAPLHAPQPIKVAPQQEDVPTVRIASEAIAEQMAKAVEAASSGSSSASPATLKPIQRGNRPPPSNLNLGPSDPWAMGGPRLVSVPVGKSADGLHEDDWADLPTRVDSPPLEALDNPDPDDIPPTVVGHAPPPRFDAQALKDAETVLLPDGIAVEEPALSEADTRMLPMEGSEPALFGDDEHYDDDSEPGPFSAGSLAEPPMEPDDPFAPPPGAAAFAVPPAAGPSFSAPPAQPSFPGPQVSGPTIAPADIGQSLPPSPAEPAPSFGGPRAPSFGGPQAPSYGSQPPPSFGGPQGSYPPPVGNRLSAEELSAPTVKAYEPPPAYTPPSAPPPQAQVFDPPPPPKARPARPAKKKGSPVKALGLVAVLVMVPVLGGGLFFAYNTFVAPADGGGGGGGVVAATDPPGGGEQPGGEQPGGEQPGGEQGGGEPVNEVAGGPAGDPGGAAQDDPGGAPSGGGEVSGVKFVSLAAGTKKMQVNCADGSARGDTEAVIDSTSAGKCRVTAILEDRSRLTVVVDSVSKGTYNCFENGESACKQ